MDQHNRKYNSIQEILDILNKFPWHTQNEKTVESFFLDGFHIVSRPERIKQYIKHIREFAYENSFRYLNQKQEHSFISRINFNVIKEGGCYYTVDPCFDLTFLISDEDVNKTPEYEFIFYDWLAYEPITGNKPFFYRDDFKGLRNISLLHVDINKSDNQILHRIEVIGDNFEDKLVYNPCSMTHYPVSENPYKFDLENTLDLFNEMNETCINQFK